MRGETQCCTSKLISDWRCAELKLIELAFEAATPGLKPDWFERGAQCPALYHAPNQPDQSGLPPGVLPLLDLTLVHQPKIVPYVVRSLTDRA